MRRQAKGRWFFAPVVAALCVMACRTSTAPRPDGPPVAGEPECYAATVARVVEDGAGRQETAGRVARAGEMWREEWGAGDGARTLIWRPDLGKRYLLAPALRLYVEADLSPGDTTAAPDPEAIERALGGAPEPVRVETRALPDQSVNGYACRVFERRAIFADGHTEVTTTFSAIELNGLALRVEAMATRNGVNVKVITERRDVRLEVPPDLFTVPEGFRRVERLPD